MGEFDDTDEVLTAGEGAPDAVELLRDDHQEVRDLLGDYEASVDSLDAESKRAIAERICVLLAVHARIEEEIFYPAARAALDDREVFDEAEVEHAMVMELVEQIQAMDPGEALYDAKIKVLGAYVAHHVDQEEGEMLRLVEVSELDLFALGEQLRDRRDELLDEYHAASMQ